MPPETTRTQASLLTKSQQLLWAGQQLSPETPLYNMAFAFHVDGELQPDVFCAAFHDLVAECDALRMVIDSEGGVPGRRTRPAGDFALPVLDFTDRAAPDQDAAAWLQASCEQPFALDQRMFASALLKLAPDRWVWFLGQHHLICDAWSVAVLFERLGTLYASRLAGESAPAGGLASFDAYARIESEAPPSGPAREHWQKISREAPSPPRLYGADNRAKSTASQRLTLPLGKERLSQLLELADRDGFRSLSREMSIFQVFATVLLAWIARVSGQQELAIAVPSHNRASPELRRAVGLLTEVFPLPVSVAEGDTFRSLYEKVRVAGTSLLRHAAPGTADAGYMRGCNVILNFIRGSFGTFAGHPVRTEWLHPGHHDREHHLRLHVHDFTGKGDWTIAFDLNREVFGDERAKHAIGHFTALLDAFLADADALITAPDILSADERAALEAFNATEAPSPRTTVLEDFQAMVLARPAAVAARCGSQSLSYRELAERSSAIAALLRANGAAPRRQDRHPAHPLDRDDRLDPRCPRGRLRLRAARPGLARCTHRLRAGERGHIAGAGRPGERGATAGARDDADARAGRQLARSRIRAAEPRRLRLRALHLGLDRQAQGRGHRARRARPLYRLGTQQIRHCRPPVVSAVLAAHLRPHHHLAVRAADLGRHHRRLPRDRRARRSGAARRRQ